MIQGAHERPLVEATQICRPEVGENRLFICSLSQGQTSTTVQPNSAWVSTWKEWVQYFMDQCGAHLKFREFNSYGAKIDLSKGNAAQLQGS